MYYVLCNIKKCYIMSFFSKLIFLGDSYYFSWSCYYYYFVALLLKNSVMLLFDFARLSAWRK